MTDQYAVIGNPVEHSLSPLIHQHFANATGEDIHYGKLFAERDAFAAAATQFFSEGGKGMNITLPFKHEALEFADKLSPRARTAQAVNTLIQHPDGQREGDNTDGPGLVRDLMHNHDLPLADMRILVLGAGGAVCGVLAPLLQERPVSLTIANRTAKKASALAHRFSEYGEPRGVGLTEAASFGAFDLIINGTSAGVSGENPSLPDGLFAQDAFACDMFYAETPTPFVSWARGQGATAWDGFGMLVEQAAESFTRWRGVRPDTAPVIAALRPSG